MKNYVQDGVNVTVAVASVVAPNNPPKSGDPAVAGRLVGVVNYDGAVGGDVVLTCEGVFNLSVSSVHNGISVGETVFIDPSSGALSDDYNDVPFGVALAAVSSGQTATIAVRLFGATPAEAGANS